MMKFKTLVTPSGEFGIVDFHNDESFIEIGTSYSPKLYGIDTEIKHLKKAYNEFKCKIAIYSNDEEVNIETFDWDSHVPSDWELKTVEIKILD